MSVSEPTVLSFLGGALSASAIYYLRGKRARPQEKNKGRIHLLQRLQNELTQLSSDLAIDFAALALYDPVNTEMRWRIAHGALNNRYLSIAIRGGRGVAGGVLQTKRSMVIHAFPDDVPEDPLEYPILLVEELKSAAAVPLIRENDVFGVLLVGQRTRRDFTREELQSLEKFTMSLSEIFLTHTAPAPLQAKEQPVTESPLVQYFIREKEKKPGQLHFELLDQQVSRISERLQILLIEVFQDIFKMLVQKSSDHLGISIERKNEQQMVFEITVNKKVDQPKQMFSNLMEKIGLMKGSVEMYNEPSQFKLVLNFSIGLLFADQDWIG